MKLLIRSQNAYWMYQTAFVFCYEQSMHIVQVQNSIIINNVGYLQTKIIHITVGNHLATQNFIGKFPAIRGVGVIIG
jgi:hypothetical protein